MNNKMFNINADLSFSYIVLPDLRTIKVNGICIEKTQQTFKVLTKKGNFLVVRSFFFSDLSSGKITDFVINYQPKKESRKQTQILLKHSVKL